MVFWQWGLHSARLLFCGTGSSNIFHLRNHHTKGGGGFTAHETCLRQGVKGDERSIIAKWGGAHDMELSKCKL